jgi:hypothetical protein
VAELTLDKLILKVAAKGNLSLYRRRDCVSMVREHLGVSERRANEQTVL